MALFPAPEPRSQRIDLLAGASRQVRLRGGALIVCTSGSLMVAEPPYRSDMPPGRYLPPPMRLNAGESHCLPEGGPLTLTAVGQAQAICLDPPGLLARVAAIATVFFGSESKNNRPNSLGALHKISK